MRSIKDSDTGMLKKWEDLPDFMRTDEVRPYGENLDRKRGQLVLKRAFDLAAGLLLLVLLGLRTYHEEIKYENQQKNENQRGHATALFRRRSLLQLYELN